MADTQLVSDVRRALADDANPDKAEGMRAYMKSQMPYRGVQKPARRKLVNAILPTGPFGHMRSWSRDSHMWKRRSSIICQINRKDETDLDLLFDCIEPNLSHTDFFIRKGIGWALRSLAWTDLPTVEDCVARNRDRLSALSAREALKNSAKIRRDA